MQEMIHYEKRTRDGGVVLAGFPFNLTVKHDCHQAALVMRYSMPHLTLSTQPQIFTRLPTSPSRIVPAPCDLLGQDNDACTQVCGTTG